MTGLQGLESAQLKRYIREVNDHPVISRDEEQDLARRYREQGDVKAAHNLVVSNLRFVVKVAHRYKGYGLGLLDLIQEGNMGLMRAVKSFDPDKGYRLISYAVWWIRAHIQTFVLKSWSLVKLGTGKARRKLFFKLRSEQSKLEYHDGLDGQVLCQELADQLGVQASEVSEMQLRMGARDFSLDKPVAQNASHNFVDQMIGDSPDPETLIQAKEEKDLALKAVASVRSDLNAKENIILDERLLSEDPSTLQSLGDQFGVSRERVRQLESRVLKKLKERLSPHILQQAS
jgi:RNA polymerase sigma-32 factor